MNEQDDFFIAFREQVKKDLEEAGITPDFFKMSMHGFGGRGRSHSYKDIPIVRWDYSIRDDAGHYLFDAGGQMRLQTGSWTEFHRAIMEQMLRQRDNLIAKGVVYHAILNSNEYSKARIEMLRRLNINGGEDGKKNPGWVAADDIVDLAGDSLF